MQGVLESCWPCTIISSDKTQIVFVSLSELWELIVSIYSMIGGVLVVYLCILAIKFCLNVCLVQIRDITQEIFFFFNKTLLHGHFLDPNKNCHISKLKNIKTSFQYNNT